MMQRISRSSHSYSRRIVALSAIGFIVGAGCAVGAGSSIQATLDEEFQLRPGETALVQPDNIEVSFLSVTSDSRCGKGETCVWAGDAVIQVRVSVNGTAAGQYDLHTNEREGGAASFDKYNIRLIALLPPAFAGRRIPANEYIAVLRIARGYAGNDGVY